MHSPFKILLYVKVPRDDRDADAAIFQTSKRMAIIDYPVLISTPVRRKKTIFDNAVSVSVT